MRIEIEINGKVRDVTVEPDAARPGRVQVSWDGSTHEVDARVMERDRHGVLLSVVRVGAGAASRQVRCMTTGRNGRTAVHLEDVVVDAVINGRRIGAEASGAPGMSGASRLTAPMPGKVVRVLVAPGDEVEARQTLVVVEAMKMENELTAPRAGTVTEVPVAEGMSIEAGRLLVAID
jgi:biotin carboxyl carrier protein